MDFKANELLVFLSLKGNGDWDSIYEMLCKKEKLSDQELDTYSGMMEDLKNNNVTEFITILDERYPTKLKESYRPPFVLYCIGDTSLLKEQGIGVVGIYDTDSIIHELNKNVVTLDMEKGFIHIQGKKSNLIIMISLDNEYIKTTKHEGDLTNVFNSLYNKLVISRDGDIGNVQLLVANSLNYGNDIFVQPTIEPSVNNTLIKSGAELIDSTSDLKD